MREMNGQFEELQFKINRNSERLEQLVADVDLRLRALEEDKAVVPFLPRLTNFARMPMRRSKQRNRARQVRRSSLPVAPTRWHSRANRLLGLSVSATSTNLRRALL